MSEPSLWPRGWWQRTPTNPDGPLSQAVAAGSRWVQWSKTRGAAGRPAGETRARGIHQFTKGAESYPELS